MVAESTREFGQKFVRNLVVCLAGTIAVYVVAHLLIRDSPPAGAALADPERCTATLSWHCFAEVDALGVVHFRSAADLRWYVGRIQTEGVREATDARSEEIERTRARVVRDSLALMGWLDDRELVEEFSQRVSDGDYQTAGVVFEQIVASLGQWSIQDAGSLLTDLRSDLARLSAMHRAQVRDAETLAPLLSKLFFWTSPKGSILEVLFWSVFGVLTNLLVNSAEYLRKGDFQPRERFVAYTELGYGPVLAVIMVLALVNGYFDIENYAVRVWTLPLVGFLFGYAARRTARLVDRLLERLLGTTEKGIATGPAAVRAKRAALVDKLMQAYEPTDLRELRDQLKEIAREVTEVTVAEREASR